MKIRLVGELQFNESLLNEDIASVMRLYPKIDKDMFMKLISLDPTYKEGRDSVGKYGKWILNLFNKGKLKEEDFYKVTNDLNKFEEKKSLFTNKDIGQFKTLPDLAKALDEVGDVELSHNQQVKQNQKARRNADLNNEATKVLDADGFEVWIPHTYAADCKLGQGTHWCTASTESDHYYNHYLDTYGGEYYILINKEDPDDKYQFHFESRQFMDYYDSAINLQDFFNEHPTIEEYFRPKLMKMFGFPADATEDTVVTAEFQPSQLDSLFKEYDYRTSNRGIDAEAIINILMSDALDWFVGGYDYGWDTAIDTRVEFDDRVTKELERLGIPNIHSAEDLRKSEVFEDSEYYDEIKQAYLMAFNDASAQGAFYDAESSVISELESCGGSWDGDTLKFKFTVGEIIRDFNNNNFEYDFEDPYYSNIIEEYALSRLVNDFKVIEPYYGWDGFDEGSFNEWFYDALWNIGN